MRLNRYIYKIPTYNIYYLILGKPIFPKIWGKLGTKYAKIILNIKKIKLI